MRDDHYFIVGPFGSELEMQDWSDWNIDQGDDPRWQSIKLADPGAVPRIMTIDEAKAEILATTA